ncbi:hypothetical protein Tco_1150131 [Tanacetum coccineum]
MKGFQDVLELFSWLSGLKVNFAKTAMFGVNLTKEELEMLAHNFNCSISAPPFEYLGVLMCANPRLVSTWTKTIDRFRERLKGWKGRFLSFALAVQKEFSVGQKLLKVQDTIDDIEYDDNKTEIWKALIKCHYGRMIPEKLIYNIDTKNNAKLSHVWNGILSYKANLMAFVALGYNWEMKVNGNGDLITFWNLLPGQKSQLEALFTLLHRIVIQPSVDDVVTWSLQLTLSSQRTMYYINKLSQIIMNGLDICGLKAFLQKSKVSHG